MSKMSRWYLITNKDAGYLGYSVQHSFWWFTACLQSWTYPIGGHQAQKKPNMHYFAILFNIYLLICFFKLGITKS